MRLSFVPERHVKRVRERLAFLERRIAEEQGIGKNCSQRIAEASALRGTLRWMEAAPRFVRFVSRFLPGGDLHQPGSELEREALLVVVADDEERT